jgi:hypothetical protein
MQTVGFTDAARLSEQLAKLGVSVAVGGHR